MELEAGASGRFDVRQLSCVVDDTGRSVDHGGDRFGCPLELSRLMDYLRPPTALAMTSRETMSAELAWTAISSLARLDKGIVSVGLNAELLVTDT